MPPVRKRQPRTAAFNLFELLFGSIAVDTLILLNVAAFFFVHFTPQGRAIFPSLILFPGGLFQGRVWTLLTSGFVHASGSHLFWNMFGLFIFGRIVERQLKPAKTLFVYFGALLVSMIAAVLIYGFVFHKNIAIVGASGAVMGLVSAAMLLDPLAVTWEMLIPLPTMMKGWLFLCVDINGFLGGEKDGISHLAHLCGFVSITVLVYFLAKKDRKKFATGLAINLLSLFVFAGLAWWLNN
ncbi:MAG: rhomboid family intramembrane serine protease [Candidatus Omnitrophica bacterium]|nr:rhomboid family intramembrane serine protease [Candidatus Omnitrophota bacterium]